jgi:Ser/Thr protein kinase RdoA (MazF antagonist)
MAGPDYQGIVVRGLTRDWGIVAPELTALGERRFQLKDGRVARVSHPGRPIEEVRREARALRALEGRAPAPRVVRTHLDDDFGVIDGLVLSLLQLPEGSPRKPPLPAEDAFSAGRLLGKLHAVWRQPREITLDAHTRIRQLDLGALERDLRAVNAPLAAKLVKLPAAAEKVLPDEPRVGGFIHGDFRPHNVLFRGVSATGAIGFERARPGDRDTELAVALFSFAKDGKDERFGAFLAGYDVTHSLGRARTLRPRFLLDRSLMILEDHARGVAGFDEADLDPLRELLA